MSCKNTRILGLSKLTLVLACLMGSGLGLLVGSLDAPLWTIYAGGFAVLLPLLIYELPRAAAEDDRERGRFQN